MLISPAYAARLTSSLRSYKSLAYSLQRGIRCLRYVSGRIIILGDNSRVL